MAGASGTGSPGTESAAGGASAGGASTGGASAGKGAAAASSAAGSPAGTTKGTTAKATSGKTTTTKEPTTKAAAPTGKTIVVDGVTLTATEAKLALDFANTASEADLRRVGVYGRGVNIILEGRPFSSMEALAQTPYIAEKTIMSLRDAVR